MRIAFGFPVARSFADISSNSETTARLASVYGSINEVDLWVGGLSEDATPGSHLGPLFHAIVRDQFEALRDGDRYWYALILNSEERRMVEELRLADIIRLNTGIGNEIQDDVFHSTEQRSDRGGRRRRRGLGDD